VRVDDDNHALVLDLRRFEGRAGNYDLEGRWDWDTLKIAGTLRLHELDNFRNARLTPESQARLTAGWGPVAAEIAGAHMLFVEKAVLRRAGSTHQIPVDFAPNRTAERLGVEIDTDTLRPGDYTLTLHRADGASAEIPLKILQPPPQILGPLRVNLGDAEQTVTLRGSGIERIAALESPGADVALQPGDGSSRDAVVRLKPGAKAGDRIELAARFDGLAQAVRLPVMLQVAAARPRIREAKASVPRDLNVAMREGELPAGSWVSFAVRVDGSAPSLALNCSDAARTIQPVTLRPGERQASAQWTQAGDAWFLSLEPGAVGPSGCTLQAAIETETGKSDPMALGRIVRLPRIEALSLTDERSAEGFAATLRGFDLETIEKVGWNAQLGVATADLPRPSGDGGRQSLNVIVPWPSPTPKAPLYVWLRGETEGRATKVTP
jgi:hypothetical protein